MSEVLKELEHFLIKKDIIVIAVSGGADSMALLALTLLLKEKLSLTIICAHVNHKVREESTAERVFVEAYCKEHGVLFEVMEILDYGKQNFHMEARQKRYSFFDEVCKKYQAKYLFTAHHGDDLMETILMRIVRGSTLKGYGGFAKVVPIEHYQLVRPLISVTKEDIYKYCQENHIPFVEDASNQKMIYTRNRYRRNMLPFLKEEDSNVHRKMLKFSETLFEYSAYVDKQISTLIENIYCEGYLDLVEFCQQDAFLQKKILYYILEDSYQEDLHFLSDKHIGLLQNLISSSKPNASLFFPKVKVVKEYGKLSFQKEEQPYQDFEIPLESTVVLPNGKTLSFLDSEEVNSNFTCYLCREQLQLPLMVRNRREGDRIEIKGMKGSKKVKDIFIDEKIPPQERSFWPIVCDSSGKIVWIPGLKKSKFDIQNREKCDIILKYY